MTKKYSLALIVQNALKRIKEKGRIHRLSLFNDLSIGDRYFQMVEQALRDIHQEKVVKEGRWWLWVKQ